MKIKNNMYMRVHRFLLVSLLLGSSLLPAAAQVSNDNKYGVYQYEGSQSSQNFVPGQVLVKFKDSHPVTVKRAQGIYQSTSSNSVTNVLAKYKVSSMEKLLPNEVAKPQSALRRAKTVSGETVTENNLDQIFHLKFDSENLDSVLMLVKELKTLDDVEYAEPNYYYYIMGAPNKMMDCLPTAMPMTTASEPASSDNIICGNPSQNAYYEQQWGITALNINKLWSKPIINSKRPVIAILDTGVDINHPDLKDNIWSNPREAEGETGYDDDGNGFVDDIHGWDFVYNYNEMDDNNSHGTHVAGIAAASDNTLGIVGANPQALIMAVKVMDDNGRGDLATIVKGINYAAQNGADVINLSLGSNMISTAMVEALENAYLTSTIVASAGNNGKEIYNKCYGLNYPGAYYCVIGVQATKDVANNTLADFSNYDPDGPIFSRSDISLNLSKAKDPTVLYGINYEVKAPGSDILSTVPGGGYASYNGTSMSAPLVAGAISALKMVKNITNAELVTDLAHFNCDFEQVYGQGRRVPDIYLAGMTIDDDVEGNKSPDGEADAGETLHIYPTLLNGWGNSGNITMKLEVDASNNTLVTIDNPEISFGYTLDAYAHSKSKDPFVVHVSENLDNEAQIKFTLTCRGENHNKTFEYYMSVKKMSKFGGLIDQDYTLTAGQTWHITKNIGIMKGATLTIEPGARLEFDEGIGLSSYGKLVANGTAGNPIVFTGYNDAVWAGINSHRSEDGHDFSTIYTNEDNSKYSFRKTTETPNKITDPYNNGQTWYYKDDQNIERKTFALRDYLYAAGYTNDFTDKQNLLTDPSFLTPIVQKLLQDFKAYEQECESQYKTSLDGEYQYSFNNTWNVDFTFTLYDNPRDTIRYCKVSNCTYYSLSDEKPACMIDCDLSNVNGVCHFYLKRCNFTLSYELYSMYDDMYFEKTNFVNNWRTIPRMSNHIINYSDLNYCNYFNNLSVVQKINDIDYSKLYSLGIDSTEPVIDHSDNPSYLGSGKKELVSPYLWDADNGAATYGKVDLSNMPTQPIADAHGILWKVVVNGKDCQDEAEGLGSIGVGTHTVELYFNRAMNKEKNPQVSFGLLKPYNQNQLEGGNWNEEGTVYTMEMKLTGKEATNGLNRFFVYGAEDTSISSVRSTLPVSM